jgi:hypothetical protein
MAAGRGNGPVAPASRADRIISTIAVAGHITDLDPHLRTWFVPVDRGIRLPPGTPAQHDIRIPQRDADRLLKGLVRFVADIPPGTSLTVAWEQGGDELLVDCASISLSCAPGLATVGVNVSCDQVPRPRKVTVPFAVGRAASPRGLLMSTFTRVDAPAIIAEGWSDAIVAFCWEALLELATRVAGDAGVDRTGKPLIPGALAAEDALLIVQPMARHDLAGLSAERGPA